MGSLTHSRRPNGRDTPHHIRCLSCRSGFFDDLLPTAVPGLDTNAGGTLCSIVPSVSGHPRRRGTGPGPPGARAEYLPGLSYRDTNGAPCRDTRYRGPSLFHHSVHKSKLGPASVQSKYPEVPWRRRTVLLPFRCGPRYRGTVRRLGPAGIDGYEPGDHHRR